MHKVLYFKVFLISFCLN